MACRQEEAELTSVDGRWELEDLGGNRTQAAYLLEVGFGLVIRGALADLFRRMRHGTRN